mgnify:CR=1 FL=1
MSRKVFISVLGTGNYAECKYEINGTVSKPVRFIQEALVEHICKEWTVEDRIFIFCTSRETTGENGSKEINWKDNEKEGLEYRLKGLNLKTPICQYDINAGFSEEEIWNIFNTVYSNLLPNDEIYFDVTHAFRSIPLFSIVLFNYSKFMLETQLKSIHYGAFEKLGNLKKVMEMPIEKRIAPVIDLSNIARLQEYNQIASGLKNFGKAKPLKDALSAQKTSSDEAMAELCKSISNLDEYIATIDIPNIKKGNFIRAFRNNFKCIKKKAGIVGPIKRILEELYDETADFVDKDSYRNIEAAINWTIKHDMLMQTYALAEEYIILYVSDRFRDIKPPKLRNKDFRMFVSSILGMEDKDFQNRDEWKGNLDIYKDVANKIADDLMVLELRPMYSPIRSARNSLAHGNGNITYQELKKSIPCIKECIEFLNNRFEKDSSNYL